MRPMFRHGAAVTLVAALAIGAVATAGPPPKSIAWQTDFKKGQAAASKQHKLMMVDFYAEW